MKLPGRAPWDSLLVASLSLGLVAAAIGVVLCELDNSFADGAKLFAIIFVTCAHGAAMAIAFGQARGLGWGRALAWFWVMGGASSALSFLVVGSLAASGSATPGIALFLIGTVVGLTYGLLLVPFALAFRLAAARNLVDAFDRVLFGGASLVAAAGGIATALEVEHAPRAGLGGLVVLGAATVMYLVAAVKTWTRARWIRAVIAGKVETWSVAEREAGDDALPAIGTRLKREATLVTGRSAGGPFRSSASAIARVARIDAAGGYGWLAAGAFACAAVTVAAVPPALRRRVEVIDHSPFECVPGPPHRFANVGDTVDLAVGANVACARLAYGVTKCWGSDAGYLLPGGWSAARKPTTSTFALGRLFLGTHEACTVVPLDGMNLLCTPSENVLDGAVEVAMGRSFKLVLDGAGNVTHAPDGDRESEADVPIFDPAFGQIGPVAHVAASERLGCALTRDGQVFCFGKTAFAEKTDLPHRVPGFGDQRVDRIAVRAVDAWARVSEGDVKHRWYAWTDGGAKLQPNWDGVEELAVNREWICGRRADDSVVCARGTETPVFTPKQVLPPGTALQLAGYSETMCARGKTDVWCWGQL